MSTSLKQMLLAGSVLFIGSAALAKLPALSDEAKAKAAEAAAKTTWTGKLEAYQLCKAQDKTAAAYKKAKAGAKDAKLAGKPAANASTCPDPGPFVYPPVTPAAAAVTAAPAPAVAASAKKS